MSNLEKRAEEYMKNYFCKKVDAEYMIKECEQGIRIRCTAFEERKEMLIEFASQETALLSKHLLEMQNTNGALTDRINELEAQVEKMKIHCNCKHRDSEGYCEVKRTYLIDLSYNGCDKWELED